MFSDGLIVTLVAVLNVSEADGRYVTLLGVLQWWWCWRKLPVVLVVAKARVGYGRVSCRVGVIEMMWGDVSSGRAIAVCG